MKLRRSLSGLGVVSLALVLMALAVSQVHGIPPEKLPGVDPEAGLSDAQREALHSAANQKQAQFLLEFVSGGKDPHSLPRLEVDSWAAGPASMRDALSQSDLVAEGLVSSTAFAPGENGSLPRATSIVHVSNAVRGALSGSSSGSVTVIQIGGPVMSDKGPALAVLSSDDLMLPSDHVLLFLKWDQTEKKYRTVPVIGVNDVTADGKVLTHGDSPVAQQLNGKSLSDAVGLLQAPG